MVSLADAWKGAAIKLGVIPAAVSFVLSSILV
jgi:hypothetical protein